MSTIQNWFDFLREQALHIDAIQFIALILGVAEVLLARANKIWLYPAGIGATVLAIYSLFKVQLYAECLLHFYYIVMSIYGWWYWTTKKNAMPIAVSFTSIVEWKIVLLIAFGGWGILYFILVTFTDSTVPLWDAWISASAWAGMWLLARRKVENWVVLNISNAFAIPLLFQKQLPLFALLTIFLFIVACFGYYDWVKLARKKSLQNINSPAL
jgi:nicotinamide mononucleotide transporter